MKSMLRNILIIIIIFLLIFITFCCTGPKPPLPIIEDILSAQNDIKNMFEIKGNIELIKFEKDFNSFLNNTYGKIYIADVIFDENNVPILNKIYIPPINAGGLTNRIEKDNFIYPIKTKEFQMILSSKIASSLNIELFKLLSITGDFNIERYFKIESNITNYGVVEKPEDAGFDIVDTFKKTEGLSSTQKENICNVLYNEVNSYFVYINQAYVIETMNYSVIEAKKLSGSGNANADFVSKEISGNIDIEWSWDDSTKYNDNAKDTVLQIGAAIYYRKNIIDMCDGILKPEQILEVKTGSSMGSEKDGKYYSINTGGQ